MLASIIYNYGKFCDDFKSTLKLGAYIKSAMYATGEDANHFKELDILDSPQSMNYEPGSVFNLNGKECVVAIKQRDTYIVL